MSLDSLFQTFNSNWAAYRSYQANNNITQNSLGYYAFAPFMDYLLTQSPLSVTTLPSWSQYRAYQTQNNITAAIPGYDSFGAFMDYMQANPSVIPSAAV